MRDEIGRYQYVGGDNKNNRNWMIFPGNHCERLGFRALKIIPRPFAVKNVANNSMGVIIPCNHNAHNVKNLYLCLLLIVANYSVKPTTVVMKRTYSPEMMCR